MGLKILVRVGTHIFFWKKYNFMHFAFQSAYNYKFFSEILNKNLCLTSKFRYGLVTLNTGIFFYYTSREFPIQNFHRRTTDIL